MKGARFHLLVATAALLALSLPAGAMAAPPDPKIKVSKKANGPFTTGTLAVGVHAKRSLYVKVFNTTNHNQQARIYEHTGGAGDFDIGWFKRRVDVSHDMQTSGHAFRLRPDRPKLFRARIQPGVPDPGDLCLYAGVSIDGEPEAYGGAFGINGNLCN